MLWLAQFTAGLARSKAPPGRFVKKVSRAGGPKVEDVPLLIASIVKPEKAAANAAGTAEPVKIEEGAPADPSSQATAAVETAAVAGGSEVVPPDGGAVEAK